MQENKIAKICANIIEAYKESNVKKLLEAWKPIYKTELFDYLKNADSNEIELYKFLFELNDEILEKWWLSPKKDNKLWRVLLLLEPSYPRFKYVLMNAAWLRMSSSGIVDNDLKFPEKTTFQKMSYFEQSKFLALFCLRNDSLKKIDYASIAEVLPAKLLPFFVTWFLQVYLSSPFYMSDEVAYHNRMEAMRSFNQFHKNRKMILDINISINKSFFNAAYYSEEHLEFINIIARQILLPSFCKVINIKNNENIYAEEERSSNNYNKAVLAVTWAKDSALVRCMSPLLEKIRNENFSFILINDHIEKAKEKMSLHWQEAPVNFLPCPIIWDDKIINETLDIILSKKFDFLFYPQVGFDNVTRYFSLLRLARVQALGYGHPITSGSPHMDYFIGGRMLEQFPKNCTERLVLLPQLGVGTEIPPAPTEKRKRPLNAPNMLIFNFSSFYKINPSLLKAWSSLLEHAGPETHLHLYPGLSNESQVVFKQSLMRYTCFNQMTVNEATPRQQLVNQLQEADLYLDSFPFGGFNTLVEVLASGCPVVTLEGNEARNRFGAAMIRLLGLPEFLITHSLQEYVDTAFRLIQDVQLRLDIRAQLERDYVLNTLCASEMADHFAAAVEWMCEQGPYDPTKPLPPVYIEAGEKPVLLDSLEYGRTEKILC